MLLANDKDFRNAGIAILTGTPQDFALLKRPLLPQAPRSPSPRGWAFFAHRAAPRRQCFPPRAGNAFRHGEAFYSSVLTFTFFHILTEL
jgi:hypothetical protein